MTGLDDVPLMTSVDEGQNFEDIRPTKPFNDVGNGNFHDLKVSSSPETETASPKENQLNGDLLQSSSNGESMGAVSDADESITETSSSDCSAGMEDDAFVGGVPSGHCYDGWKMSAGAKEIVFQPDFLSYEKIYSTDCELIFYDSFVEVKGVAVYGHREDFYIQLRMGDIVEIESQWIGRFQTARVKVHAILKDESNHMLSGIKKLEFAVTDMCWYEKCEALRSLDVYNSLWKVITDTEMEEYGETSGQNSVPFQTSYFPDFKPFEDFIYPEGDADAVSISKRDVDLLQPDTFVNDTIIDFYIKYLKDKMLPEKKQRFHFFNSFFFRKLADLDKYPSGSFDGRAAFLRVHKWTRKVNLFEKDFIFIPVNHNYHWSLLVICHPGEVANFRDEDGQKLARVPCILHMDSIRGTHVDLKDRIQSYLWEEWKERQKETSEDISSKFSNLRFVSLELPQQQNSYDCGLFLLHYVEQFLEEDPANISPFKITPLSVFLTADWFPSSEPSLKRHDIQKLIYDLLENHSKDTSPASSSDKCYPCKSPKSANAIEFLSESFSPSKDCSENLLCSRAEKGIEMTLFPAISMRGADCANDAGMASREHFESGSAGSLIDLQYQALDRMASFNDLKSAMTALQDAETSGNLVYSTSTENGFQHLGSIKTEACNYPCPSRDFRNEVSWNQEISVHRTPHENCDSVPPTSICDTGNSLEVQADEKCEVAAEISLDDKLDLIKHASTENIECLTDGIASAHSKLLDFADSHYANQSLHQHDNSLTVEACSKSVGECLNQDNRMDGNRCTTFDDDDEDEDATLESEVLHAAKRLRLTPTSEGEKK
ncbi:hypothetical protein ACH5RR_033852 [Cinchona calisaya]|uniref:Ubiquitin-like protease family profile domain-containing protein n=1 Tax=Cinchona calisaya TaxID=153742 RepID=A0ABD2YBF1_9GENT